MVAERKLTDEEDRIFEERTRKALEEVESNPNRYKLSKEEFIKELASW